MRYEIRAQSASEILDTAFRILRNHFGLLVGIAASVYVPMSLLWAALGAVTPAGRPLLVLLGGGLVAMLVAMIGTTIVFAGITWAIAELYRGHTIGWREVLARGQHVFVPLVGTTLLSSLLALLGFILLVLPCIYLLISWIVLWPVMLIENRFGMTALRRSRMLMRGNLLRGAGLLFVVWLVSVVLTTGLSLPVAALPMLHALVSGGVNAVTTAYGAAVAVLLYFDIRCRKEAFDLEHLAALVSPGQSAEPTTA